MEKQDLISVIVPVWNVEKYLNKCLESVVNQTYKNLEIILVDDGSPDNCPQMCDEWAKKDSRIKVIHKENGGPGEARNFGLREATGRYIAFADSDDFLEPTMYEKLYQEIKNRESDIVFCKYYNLFEDGSKQNVEEVNFTKLLTEPIYPYLLKTGKKTINDTIYYYNIMGCLWRSLFRKEILEGITFLDFGICEDLIYMIDVFKRNPKVGLIEDPLYGYLIREGSQCRQFNDKKVRTRLLSGQVVSEKLNGLITEEEMQAYKYHLYAGLVNELLRFGKQKDIIKYIDNDFGKTLNTKQNYKSAMKTIKSFSYKVAYWLIRHKMFTIYKLILKITK